MFGGNVVQNDLAIRADAANASAVTFYLRYEQSDARVFDPSGDIFRGFICSPLRDQPWLVPMIDGAKV